MIQVKSTQKLLVTEISAQYNCTELFRCSIRNAEITKGTQGVSRFLDHLIALRVTNKRKFLITFVFVMQINCNLLVANSRMLAVLWGLLFPRKVNPNSFLLARLLVFFN